MTGGDVLTVAAVAGAALLDSLNPCAFALLLVFVATTLSMASRVPVRARLLGLGSAYILGVFVTYLGLGLGLGSFLRISQALSGTHLAARLAAWVAIGLGVVALQEALAPEWGTRLAAHVDAGRLKRRIGQAGPAVLFSAGALVGLCTVPCSGSVYLAVLGLLSAQESAGRGLALLVFYNLVFVAPLFAILLACAARPVWRALARWQVHHRAGLKLGVGIASAAVGLITLAVV
ncbi:MAG: GAP family protein [Bacillota bacterium]